MFNSQSPARCTPPPRVDVRMEPLGSHRARISLQPLERGMGTTLGVAVGRAVLSASPGRVSHAVAPTGVGERRDFDRVSLDIETDGSLSPADALEESARRLAQELSPYARGVGADSIAEAEAIDRVEGHEPPFVMRSIDELGLSVRTSNCLKANNVHRVGDLVSLSETELLRTPNLGRRNVNDIKEVLMTRGLRLGRVVPMWPPLTAGGA